MTLPTRIRSSFPQRQFLPSRSLHKSLILMQTEEARTTIPQPPERKPQSQKTNQNHHMVKLWTILCRLPKTDGSWRVLTKHGPLQYSCLESKSESHSVVSDSLWPHGLYPWNSPGQNAGVGSLSLLQVTFPTQELNQVSCIAGRFFTSWATREALLALRTPWTVWKGKKIWHWKMSSPGH